MLYLLNSGFREAYFNNILNTLNLPEGLVNEYEYSVKSDDYCVHPSVDDVTSGERVIVMFVDLTDANHTKFYPIREGTFKSKKIVEEKMRIEVVLGRYCYAPDIEEFYSKLWKNERDKICPKKLGCNLPGSFAFCGHDCSEKISYEDTSWKNNVESLINCKEFVQRCPVITKTQLYKEDKLQMPVISIKGKRFFRLSAETEYYLRVSYYIPSQVKDRKFIVKVIVVSNVKAFTLLNEPLSWGTKNSYEDISLKTINKGLLRPANIRLVIDYEITKDNSVTIAEKPIPISVKRNPCRGSLWLVFGICLFIDQVVAKIPVESTFNRLAKLIEQGHKLGFLDKALLCFTKLMMRYDYFFVIFAGISTAILLGAFRFLGVKTDE